MFATFSALSVYGRGAARLAAATLVSGLVAAGVLAGAGRAVAGETRVREGGASATLGGLKTYGTAVVHGDDGDEEVPAGLYEMSVEDGGTLQTYGVDLHNPAQPDARYQETPWSSTSLGGNKDAGRIRWIVENSYPQVNDLAELARRAGVSALTEQDAAAGTQVAVWRYADGADVDATDPRAEKLADYLEASAHSLPEPDASLTLENPAVSGHPGGLLGPVTVHTNATGATVTPPANAALNGVRVVDRDGRQVTTVTDGGRIYFDVPKNAANGSASLTVQTSTTVPVGRALTADTASQTQILAGSSESTVSATATANWAKRGAIPALSAARNCADGALDITVADAGDKAFTFELMGTGYTVAAGESRTVSVKLQEDQPYDFPIDGPSGYERRFTGVLDCATEDTTSGTSPQTLSDPSPATVGGTSTSNLAETGTSDATWFIAGTAIALVMIGGAVLVTVGRDRTPAEH
ncbi:putative domain CHP03934, TQXA [Actinobacteria bacterium OK074]|nr:putative domain CHP03934, TQXA [Actinobacteria bacterium OK074]